MGMKPGQAWDDGDLRDWQAQRRAAAGVPDAEHRAVCRNKAVAFLQEVEVGGPLVQVLGPDRMIAMAAVYATLAHA